MLSVSEVLMSQHDLESFQDVLDYVKKRAQEGEMFIEIDLKPPFPDTPENWEDQIEIAFTSK